MQIIAMSFIGYAIARLSFPNYFIKHKIKRRIDHFCNDNNFINCNNKKILVENINLYKWGFTAALDISEVCQFKDIENKQDYLKQLFRAFEINLTNKEGYALLEVINKHIEDIDYKHINMPNTSLLIGYDNKGLPIQVDMLKTPHVGVQGTSNSGKSKMVEIMLMNLTNIDIVLLNTFKEDFKRIQARRINGNENILNYLKRIIEEPYKRDNTTYIVIDEVNVLGKDKQINKAISDVLSQARHYNIYLIALGQSLLKENCPYKQLFNVRVAFRCIDKSTISAFLGCNLEDTELQQRQFICYADNIYRGVSYRLTS